MRDSIEDRLRASRPEVRALDDWDTVRARSASRATRRRRMRPLYLAGALAGAVLLSAGAVAGTGAGVNSFDLLRRDAASRPDEPGRRTGRGDRFQRQLRPGRLWCVDRGRPIRSHRARQRPPGSTLSRRRCRIRAAPRTHDARRDLQRHCAGCRPETASFGCVWTLDQNALDPSVFRRGNTIVAYGLAPKDADTIMLQRADGSTEKLPVKDGMILVGYNAAEVGVSPPDRVIALRDGEQFRCAQLEPAPQKRRPDLRKPRLLNGRDESPSSRARRSTNSTSSASIASSSGGRSYVSRSSRQRRRARCAWSSEPPRVQRSWLSVVATVGRQKQSRKRSSVCCGAEEVAALPDLGVGVEGEAGLVDLGRRELVQQEVEQLAVGHELLEQVTRPPSSQPADCQHTLAPARNAACSVFMAS